MAFDSPAIDAVVRQRRADVKYVPPVKPSELGQFDWWVSVEKLIDGHTGVKGIEDKWACEFIFPSTQIPENVARFAAKDWYSDTDQAGSPVRLCLRLEDGAGKVVFVCVTLVWALKAVTGEALTSTKGLWS